MIRNHLAEFGIAISLLAVAAALINPYWMPMGLHMLLLVALIISFGIYAVFLWREGGGDEREQTLLQKSDRVGFLLGASILAIALVYEGFIHHHVDSLVVAAFVAMILGKALSFIYFKEKN